MKNIILTFACALLLQNASAGIAENTSVQTPAGNEPVNDLIVGDLVTTKAGPRKVVFNNSGSGDQLKGLLRINYGESLSLLVTAEQPFKMPDGSFKKASSLVPGKDSLVNVDGKKVSLTNITPMTFDGDIHFIIVSSNEPSSAKSADEHTMLVNGIWLGDKALENLK